MIAFWAIGAALAAAALLLLLRPVLFGRPAGSLSRKEANISIYRDQMRELEADLAAGKLAATDYERARTELEARLLEDVAVPDEAGSRRRPRAALLALAAVVPIAALAIYLVIGTPAALDGGADPHGQMNAQLEGMVERLAAKLRENPDDADAWKLLGRSYAVLGRFPEAADAYAKAAVRSPRDAQLLADFADALAMARGERRIENPLSGEPERLVQRALEIDPSNLKALALAGTIEFNRRQFAAAAGYWKRMLPHVEPGSEDARIINANIQEAIELAGSPGPSEKSLQGTVSLSPRLKDKVSPEDTVFIYARAAEGPPMPLALQRLRVRDLPAKFALTDAMAMSPGMNLSAHPRVVITARISKSGQATPQPGDLTGASKPVANDASGVAVVIDTLVR